MIDKKNNEYRKKYSLFFFTAYYPAPQILTIVKEKEKKRKWEQ